MTGLGWGSCSGNERRSSRPEYMPRLCPEMSKVKHESYLTE
jgi:hypothetical protein